MIKREFRSTPSGYASYSLLTFVMGCSRQRVYLLLPIYSRAYAAFTRTAFAEDAALDSSGFDSTYKFSLPKPVQDKTFYLLSLFQETREVRKTSILDARWRRHRI